MQEIEENEYNYTPPSLTRTKEDPFIKAKLSKFWLIVWHFFVNLLLRRRFYSVRVKNAKHYDLINKDYPCIYYTQHTCWWDGMVGYYLFHYLFKDIAYMMIEDLIKFPLFSRVGAFSIDKKSPRTAMKSLKYCIDFMKNEKRSLWIFPQGKINPPNHRPIKFQKGMAFIAEKVGKVNLVPITMQYPFLRLGLPEVLIDIGNPIILNGEKIDKDEFNKFLEEDFTKLADNQLKEISNGEVDKYNTIMYRKSPGLGKHLEKLARDRKFE